MTRLRLYFRLLAFFVSTSGLYLMRFVTKFLFFWWPSAERAMRGLSLRVWGRTLAWAIGAKISVEGELPKPPFFLVTNHLGYCDIVVLASLISPVFVSKQEVGSWPLLGMTAKKYDTIMLNRERNRDIIRVNEKMEKVLEDGMGLVFFPEGTSSGGETVLPLKPSLLDVAARSRLPVHYATLAYATPPGSPPARDAVCWWGGAEFMPHFLKLLTIPRFSVRVKFGEAPVEGNDRKELAVRLHELLEKDHVPVDSWTGRSETHEYNTPVRTG